MIILRHIHLENFMCIDSLDLNFNNDTIISISGKNGSGKSALIYAIALCITGYRYGESYRDYVKSGEDTSSIILDAELKGEPIHYEVSIKGNNKTGNPLKKEVTYKGITYLNSDYSSFMKDNDLDYIENLMFLFQGNNELISSKPSERAAILRRLFQFEFTSIVSSFKEKLDQDKVRMIKDEAVLNELQKRTFQEYTLLREVPQSRLDAWEDEIKDLNESIFKLTNIEAADYNADIEYAKKKIVSFNNNLNYYKEEKVRLEKIINTPIDQTDFSILEEMNKEHDTIQLEIQKLNSSVLLLEKDADSLSKQIEIGKKGICHSCGQPVDKSHVDKLRIQQEEINKTLASQKEEREVLIKKFNKLTSDIKKMEKQKRDYEKLAEQIDLAKKNLYDTEVKITDNEYDLNKWNNTLRDLENKQEAAQEALNLLANKNSLISKRDELQTKLSDAKEVISINKEKANQNSILRKERDDNNRRIREMSININSLSSDMNISKQCLNIFENQFPNYILLRACGQLENYINNITNTAFKGFRVKLNQSRGGVSFFYKTGEMSDDEDWLPVCLASGAQKTILSLAYIIALGRMYGINCLLLDEVDSACSPETAKTIYKFIAELEGFNQIIFISHNEESREAMKESNRDNIIFYSVSDGNYELMMEE